jgi:hypothetical protein
MRSGDVGGGRVSTTYGTHQCWHNCRVTSEKRRRACRGAFGGAESGEAQLCVSGIVEPQTCGGRYPHRCPTTRCALRNCQLQMATQSCHWWGASASRCRWCFRTAGGHHKKAAHKSGALLSAPGARRAPHCHVRGQLSCKSTASRSTQARACGEGRRYASEYQRTWPCPPTTSFRDSPPGHSAPLFGYWDVPAVGLAKPLPSSAAAHGSGPPQKWRFTTALSLPPHRACLADRVPPPPPDGT